MRREAVNGENEGIMLLNVVETFREETYKPYWFVEF